MTIVSTGSLSLKDLNDAKQLSMFIGGTQSKQVIYDGVSIYNPNYATTNNVLTPQLRIAGGGSDVSASASATRWYYQTGGAGTVTQITASGTDYTLGGTQPITLTLKTNLLVSNLAMNYICEMDYVDPDTGFTVTSKADFQIYKVVNGVNTVTPVINNENVTLPATNNGTVSVYTGSNATVQVYEGSTALTYDGVGTSNGKFNVTVAVSNVTAGTVSGSGTTTYAIGNITAFTQAQDIGTITFTISGKTSIGGSFSFTKVQNFNKAKLGADSTIQYLTMPSVFSAKQDGTYYTSSFVINAYQVAGTAVATAYNGYIKIETSVLGNFTDTVTAVANTQVLTAGAYTWTVTAGIKAFRVTLYTASGGVGQVDQETVTVIQDGKNAININTWCPNGNTILNSNGSVLVETDLFDGIQQVAVGTPAYKWYIQDPTATTASGGDTDGGNGYRLITAIAQPATNPTTTVPTTAGATLPVASYYVKYTWVNLIGETQGNTTQVTQATTAVGQALVVQVPVFPTGVVSANVYVGNVTGDANLYYQGNIAVSNGSLTIKSLVATGNKVPTVNTAGGNTYQITVSAFAVVGMEAFKCVATYNANKYTNVATVVDASDPISVVISGVDTFKNGVGTTVLKALCYQTGAEIDPTGSIYTYTWTLYDSNNASITAVNSILNTGKSVTVDGRDFVGRASIICQVSK